MFVMQKMTTMPSTSPQQDSTNRMMLWMMPVMFGFFTIQFPSGLAIYWIVSNIVGIIIQGVVTGWDPILKILNLVFLINKYLKTKSKINKIGILFKKIEIND